jgi:hemerythrin-like domain-containing protein
MNHTSLRMIHEEHASLMAVLRSMGMMVERGPDEQPEVFFDLLRAMLFYMDEFPEKQHHTKETELLFPTVAARSKVASRVISKLAQDRALVQAKIRELQQQLPAWEMLGDSRREVFETNLKAYVEFYVEHIALEETVVIPEALKVLEESDWRLLDANFNRHCNPVTGKCPREPLYDRLYTRIAMHSPAHMGLGRHHIAHHPGAAHAPPAAQAVG